MIEKKKERKKKHQYIYAGARRYSYLLRESSFNMTREGDEDIETRSLKF